MKFGVLRSLLTVAVLSSMACANETTDELGAGGPDLGEPASSMLPAGMTAQEQVGKADGHDPRDQYPDYYGFTQPFTDPGVVSGEFEDADELLIGWGSGAWELEQFFMDMLAVSVGRIPVTIIVPDSQSAQWIRDDMASLGIDSSGVQMLVARIDSIWMRDYGPLVTRSASGYKVVDPRYYWGRWYDDLIPSSLAGYWQEPVSRPPIEMEGGNFQSDGAGRCITTDMLYLQNASRGYTEAEVDSIFQQYYGCQTTTVVPRLVDEGTGHIDMFAHITAPGEVLVGQYDPLVDPSNAAATDEAARRMASDGFNVTRIPMPSNEGHRLWRTYTNALAVNDIVMVPVYDEDPRFEQEALTIYQKAYPNKTIVPIDSDDVIYWSGAVHCVTMTR